MSAAANRVCPFGDPFCPCQDGDPCHYTGWNPMRPPPPPACARCGAVEDEGEPHEEGCGK